MIRHMKLYCVLREIGFGPARAWRIACRLSRWKK